MRAGSAFADDPRLRPRRRGGIGLPFTTTEWSEAETRRRILITTAVVAVVAALAAFLVLLNHGMYPQWHVNQRLAGEPPHVFISWLLVIGAAVVSAATVLFVMYLPLTGSPPDASRPWTYIFIEVGLTIRHADGDAVSGPWSAWRLVGYDTLNMPGSGVPAAIHLALNDQEHTIRLVSQKAPGRIMRAIVQKLTVQAPGSSV